MKNSNSISFSIFILGFLFLNISCSQKSTANFSNEKQLLKDWRMQSSTQVPQNGDALSVQGFTDTAWVKAQVPTSVLGALVKAGIYPDPHFDLNDLKIPDASDDLSKRLDLNKYSYLKGVPNPFKDPYWFRTTFTVPKENNGKRVWLNFDGINYRADVWINGKQIATATEMAGMFLRFKYDVTPYVNYDKENVVAVKIHQVDNVGNPNPGYMFEPFGPGRGKVRDTTIHIPKAFAKHLSAYKQAKEKKYFRQRAGIEPVIGHLKADHRLSRNFYKVVFGDNINVMLAAAAFNFKRMMNKWKGSFLSFLQHILY